jgi:hypothetical protein
MAGEELVVIPAKAGIQWRRFVEGLLGRSCLYILILWCEVDAKQAFTRRALDLYAF